MIALASSRILELGARLWRVAGHAGAKGRKGFLRSDAVERDLNCERSAFDSLSGSKLCQANANPLSQECVVGFDHFDPGYPAGAAEEIERHKLIILDQQNLLIIDPPHERCTRNSSSRLR